MSMLRSCLSALVLLATACSVSAGEAAVAVAANFITAAQRIETAYETAHPHTLTLISGSTGKLAAQIVHGAPFDVFLAADQQRPQWLEDEGLTVKGSRFTYALGSLLLCSNSRETLRGSLAETLAAAGSVAVANPQLAPYGRAAHQVLEQLGGPGRLNLITGQSVGQVYGFLVSGNVGLGFIARSQLAANAGDGLSCIDVPANLHDPVLQDAVLLARASQNDAALSFMAFLASQTARDLIAAAGYGLAE